MIEFRHLETFRCVMNTCSFTRAANQLRTSQPTVSRTIAELQRHLGFRLFMRKGGAVVPTSEALEFSRAVNRSFVGIDTILREGESIAGRRKGQLRVLSLPALALSFLPRVVASFQASRPHVSVSIEMQRSEAIAGWSSTEYFDVGFSMLPIHRHGVATKLFSEARGMCIMRDDHPLTTLGTVTPADLNGVDFVSSGPLSYGARQQRLDTLLAEAGATLCVRAETPITVIACQLVAEGVGVAIVDEFVAESYRSMRVVARPFEPKLVFNYGVFTPRTSVPNLLADDFVAEAFSVQKQLIDGQKSRSCQGNLGLGPISFRVCA